MALPREERSIGLQITQPQDVSRGLRAAGEAQAESGRAINQALQPLAQLFLQEGQKVATETGQEAAAAMPLERGPDGQLQPPDLSRSAFTTAGQEGYRAVLTNRYASEFQLDSQRTLLDLRKTHASDPDAFLAAAQSHRNGLLSTLPPALRVPVGDAFGRQMAQHYNNLFEQRFARDQAQAGALAGQLVEQTGRDIVDATRAGDTRGAAELAARLTAQTSAHVAAGTMRPEAAAAMVRRFTVVEPLLAQMASLSDPSPRGGRDALEAAVTSAFPEARITSRDRPGSGGSQHNHGTAIDIDLRGMSEAQREALVRRALSGEGAFAEVRGIGTYNGTGDKLHLDLRQGGFTAWGPNRSRDSLSQTPGWFQAAVNERGARGDPPPGRATAPMPDILMARATALDAGPGSPGWQPAFDRLALEERRDLAQVLRARAAQGRAEVNYNRSEQARELTLEGIDLQMEARTPGVSIERQATIQARLDVISRTIGSTTAMEHADRMAARAREATNAAGTTAVLSYQVDRDLQRIASSAVSDSTADGQASMPASLLSRLSGQPLPVQAQILGDVAGRMEQAAIQEARLNAPRQQFEAALATGIQVGNGAPMQGAARERFGENVLVAPPHEVVAASAVGVLPTEVAAQISRQIATGDVRGMEAAARLQTAMQRNPLAQATFDQVVPAQTRMAIAGFAQDLVNAPTDATRAAWLQSRVADAQRINAADPTVIDAQRARLGSTPAEVRTAVLGFAAPVLREKGLPAVMPPRMQQAYEREFLMASAVLFNPAQAAELALSEVQRKWTSSRTTIGTDGFAVGTQFPGTGLIATLRNNNEGLPPRWVEEAAERHVAIFGRDRLSPTSRTTPGSQWLTEDFRPFLTRLGVNPGQAQSLALGHNAVWQPTSERNSHGDTIYQLRHLRRGDDGNVRGMDTVYRRDASGRLTDEPVQAALAEEARRHNDAAPMDRILAAGRRRVEDARSSEAGQVTRMLRERRQP